MKRLRILVWCPNVGMGGGHRLLGHLTKALINQSQVEHIKIVHPVWSVEMKSTIVTSSMSSVEFSGQKNGRFITWLKIDRRIFNIWGTDFVKRLLSTKVIQIKEKHYTRRLSKLCHDIDVVYAFWPHLDDPPNVDKPLICTIQDTLLLDFPELLGGHRTRTEWIRTNEWMQKSSRIIVSSHSTKTTLQKHFGEKASSAIVIHHAISPLDNEPNTLRETILKKKLPQHYLIFPANTSAQKNHYTLLVAWSHFSHRKEFPLVLFGYGTDLLTEKGPEWPEHWQAARLSGLIYRSGLHLGQDLFTLGFVNDQDVKPLIAGASALIMPTLGEGGGSFPIEEALDLGIPVLCSDIPVLREQLEGRSAKVIWFDPQSPDSIVDALNTLFDNYNFYKSAAEKTNNVCRPSWDAIAAQYVQVFQSVISSNNNNENSSKVRHE